MSLPTLETNIIGLKLRLLALISPTMAPLLPPVPTSMSFTTERQSEDIRRHRTSKSTGNARASLQAKVSRVDKFKKIHRLKPTCHKSSASQPTQQGNIPQGLKRSSPCLAQKLYLAYSEIYARFA